jgi:hypothetical protein
MAKKRKKPGVESGLAAFRAVLAVQEQKLGRPINSTEAKRYAVIYRQCARRLIQYAEQQREREIAEHHEREGTTPDEG